MTARTKLICAFLILGPLELRGQDSFPIQLKIGVQTASTKRNTSLSDEITARTSASISGLEATLYSDDAEVGIGGRLLSGSYGNGDLNLKEVRVLAGTAEFHLEGAYGQRSIFGTDSMFTFTRAGAQLMIPIGGSGVSLNMSGSKYFTGDFGGKQTDLTKIDGWEGETDLFYSLPTIPVYLQFGYRNEYFLQGDRAENLNGLILGAGLWLGGR